MKQLCRGPRLPAGTSATRLGAIPRHVCTAAVPVDDQTQFTLRGVEPSIDIYYRSDWSTVKLHGSVSGGPWQDFPLRPVPSSSGRWHHTSLVPPTVEPGVPLLEFVATDGAGSWDKPTGGSNYTVLGTGKFTVRHGELSRVPSSPPAVLVVSDLDGTMVGDDEATAAFKRFWQDSAVVRGGVLVYNTGRSLQSFEQLLKDKAHCIAHPDVLISAVGTKIYNFTDGRWVEDLGWILQLELDWQLDRVREATYRALGQVGREKMHFRPPEEQNDHKVTCGVATAVLDSVVASIEAALKEANVKVNIITSGSGEWRFMDIVPAKAGKLEALNYVRAQHKFPHHRTVGCGDSGNDILMLSGENLALVVSNAQSDLKRWVDRQLKREKEESAPGARKRLLVAGKHEAYGILEGLEYWGLK